MGNKKPPRTFKRKLQGDKHFSFSYKIQILKDCRVQILLELRRQQNLKKNPTFVFEISYQRQK